MCGSACRLPLQVNLRSSMKLLDIGEVASKSGLQPSALRHYEEAGLIAPVTRHGLRRQFEPQALIQLKLIAMGKSAGFSLEDIAGMFGRDGLQIPRARHAPARRRNRPGDSRADNAKHPATPCGGMPGSFASRVPDLQAVDGIGRQAIQPKEHRQEIKADQHQPARRPVMTG